MSALALDDEQRSYVRRVREVAVDLLPLVEKGTEGRVDRPLLRAMGGHGLLRGLFGGTADEPVRDAAAMQLCLLRETLAGGLHRGRDGARAAGAGQLPDPAVRLARDRRAVAPGRRGGRRWWRRSR